MSETKDPSSSVRVSLYQGESQLANYQTTPISKHYSLNNQILAAFESHYESKLYEIAFYLGLKFVETALIEIPKHGYFRSKKHKEERMQSSADTLRVTQLLQGIIAEEPEALAKEWQKVERLTYLADQQSKSPNVYESERLQIEKELYGKSEPASKKPRKQRLSRILSTGDQDCMSSTLLACGDSISSILCPGSSSTVVEAAIEVQREFADDSKKFEEEGKEIEDSNYHSRQLIDTKPEEESVPKTSNWRQESLGSTAPPPPILRHDSSSVFAPPPEHYRSQSDLDLERALFLSGLQFTLENEEKSNLKPIAETRDQPPGRPTPPGAKKRESSSGISTELLTDFSLQDFTQLKTSGRVIISQMKTYQGKNPGSTNGCTVIAPLICIHHFHNDSVIPDQGLTDTAIEQILDEEVPSILPMIRENLGLGTDAFIIQSDAHEALMNQQLLASEQFLNVFGGNILHGDHLKPLLKQLSVVGDKKVGATFFFHEHVISILQLRRSEDTVWFDLIDSLPHSETLLREDRESTQAVADSSQVGGDDAYRIASDLGDFDESHAFIFDDVPQEPAFRMRCLDVQALEVVLQWYACSVFSDEDANYIDTYQWDESLADFDPRVFQAFVWTEA